MNTLLVAALAGVGYLVAYHTYGRFLARKIFELDPEAVTPSREHEDGVDYVPARREVIFGHHFTSIAGTGPIVGPAIAVFWGWLPALLWVLLGSIFIGAVHDFGALVVSMRSRGYTIGEVAGRMISPRARMLFFLILFFSLTIVIGIFGLVIAVIFSVYPETVFSVWVELPIAVAVGFWIYRRGGNLLWPSLIALALLYVAVAVGVYWLPISFGESIPLYAGKDAAFFAGLKSSIVIWTGILLVYCFVASTLPVWTLLQPRDYINSHQLFVALGLLGLGLLVARPDFVAPAINPSPPSDAPPIFPFLFITIACGAVSGFHCMVSSGTTSKQIRCETDAQIVGYGSMLLESALAVLVIIACCAGLGLGVTDKATGQTLSGAAAWQAYYGGNWDDMKLAQKVGAFIDGGAAMVAEIGLDVRLAVGIVAVMAASFAATTLDTATRLQRYVIQELGAATGVRLLRNKYAATLIAVLAGGALALTPGPLGPGSGGFILWPLFGATNQLLAGLAFLVIAFYLVRLGKPVWFLALPLALLVVMPAWAMVHKTLEWAGAGNWLLVGFGVAIEALQVWMVIEGALMWRRARGVPPEPFPAPEQAAATGP
jgi:carbon starvation protein